LIVFVFRQVLIFPFDKFSQPARQPLSLIFGVPIMSSSTLSATGSSMAGPLTGPQSIADSAQSLDLVVKVGTQRVRSTIGEISDALTYLASVDNTEEKATLVKELQRQQNRLEGLIRDIPDIPEPATKFDEKVRTWYGRDLGPGDSEETVLRQYNEAWLVQEGRRQTFDEYFASCFPNFFKGR
jgi:hypothetical protein